MKALKVHTAMLHVRYDLIDERINIGELASLGNKTMTQANTLLHDDLLIPYVRTLE